MALLKRIYDFLFHPEIEEMKRQGVVIEHIGKGITLFRNSRESSEPLGFPHDFARRVSEIYRDEIGDSLDYRSS